MNRFLRNEQLSGKYNTCHGSALCWTFFCVILAWFRLFLQVLPWLAGSVCRSLAVVDWCSLWKHSELDPKRAVAYLGFGKGGAWRVRGAWAYNGGLAKPPWSWNIFCFWMFNGNRKFAHFFCKNAPFHTKSPVKNFPGRAKGGASHRAPP